MVKLIRMNTAKIIVRLDAEYRTAEIELLTLKDRPRIAGLEHALRRIGLRPMHTVEFSTPSYRVTRTKVARTDGSELNVSRIEKALRAIRSEAQNHSLLPVHRAA